MRGLWVVKERDGSYALGPSHDARFHMLMVFTKKSAAESHCYNNDGRKVEPLTGSATMLALQMAVEWGYKQCEKGENIQGALRNFAELMK